MTTIYAYRLGKWIIEFQSWLPEHNADSWEVSWIPGIVSHSCEYCTTHTLSWLFWAVSIGRTAIDINDEMEGEDDDYTGPTAGAV